MQFIGDENISKRLMQILDIFDGVNQSRHITDYFDPGTPDLDWLKEMGEWDVRPVVLSGDGAILKNKAERRQLRDANMTYIVWSKSWVNMGFEGQVVTMLKAWPKLRAEVIRIRQPSLFELRTGGKLVLNGPISKL